MIQRFLLLFLLLAPTGAPAQPVAPDAAAQPMAGNLAADFYPKPSCVAPSNAKPIKPSYSDDPSSFSNYNAKIRQINQQAGVYNSCMQAYSAGVDNDFQGILSTVNGAVAEATGRPPPAPPATPGNLPLGFYPKPSCTKPDREALGAIPSATDRAAMTAYNLRVKTFNDQVSAFNACLKTYEEKAQRDIAQMQAISHQAMAPKDAPGAPSR